MSTSYVLTLLAKDWNQQRAQSFLTSAQAQGLSFRADEAGPLDGASLWMQRVWAGSQTGLTGESLEHLRAAAENAGMDVFVESEALYRTPRRLFVFDMDSTLIQAEVIDELAGLAGVKDQVSAITAAAMRGEIDFPTSLTRRVSLLKGIREERIGALKTTIALGEGLESLMQALKSAGCKTAILSGGFGFFGRDLQQRLGFDHLCANELEIADGALTGRLATAVVDGQRKAAALREIAERESIPLQQVVAVGDGANDLRMLALAGTGVAYHAKPIVRAAAAFRLNYCGLNALLHLLDRS
ncbi:MAG TPA: phosphoserine phosphatase SerB [Candidatus Saccharimonadales bacterium]|nr:phosphoserine phosphatase SerB [Candidatus Saccharimonadales bacterium]